MLRFGKGVVKLRWVILALSVLLLIPSVIGFLNTHITISCITFLMILKR